MLINLLKAICLIAVGRFAATDPEFRQAILEHLTPEVSK